MPFLNGHTGTETQWCQIFLFFKEKMDIWIFQIRNLPRFSFGKHWMAKQIKSVAYGLPVGNLQVYFCNRGLLVPTLPDPLGVFTILRQSVLSSACVFWEHLEAALPTQMSGWKCPGIRAHFPWLWSMCDSGFGVQISQHSCLSGGIA